MGLALWLPEWGVSGSGGEMAVLTEKTLRGDDPAWLPRACPSSGHLFKISFLRPTAAHNCPFQPLQNSWPWHSVM